jgi:hypothetical protein
MSFLAPLSSAFGAFDSQNNLKDQIEDESIAILLLIAASGSLTRNTWQSFGPWFLKRFGVPTGDYLAEALKNALLFGPEVSSLSVSKPNRRAINPFLIALLAEQILPRLGVPTPTSKIMERYAAQKLIATHIVKSGRPGNRLKWISPSAPAGEYARVNAWAASVDGEYALVSEIVPDAASIDYVRRVLLSLEESFNVRDVFLIECEGPRLADCSIAIREPLVWRLIGEISKSCGLADKLFEQFKPTEPELAQIRNRMSWNSERYLRIHAARVFLGLTCAHFSNVLVTRNADLVSIDHDCAFFESGEDVEMLFRFVRRGSEVWKMLDHVAALTEADVRASIAAIPKHPAVGSATELEEYGEYFVRRLALWKKLAGRATPEDSQRETQNEEHANAVGSR